MRRKGAKSHGDHAQETLLARRRRAVSQETGTLMGVEAVAFALASIVHFATNFTDAAIPELVIAAVLGFGGWAVLSRRAHAWGTAVGTTSFATFGTLVGLTIIATGRQDAPDLAYHAGILTTLVITLIALWRGWGLRR